MTGGWSDAGPVLVVGDVLVDVVAEHRDPIAPGSDTTARIRLSGGGSAANAAAWLASLPYQHRVGDVAFCHGSPVNHEDFEYIFSQEQMLELVNAYPAQAPVTFIGHSHLCRAFGFSATQVTEVLRTRFHLEPDRKYLITVGSTGQPRDYDNRASFTTFDTEARRFSFRRVEYDIEREADRIRRAGLPAILADRLFLGI